MSTEINQNMHNKEIATLGGGCFWCLEAIYTDLKGVEKVVSGYSGGRKENPSYQEVSRGDSGHAEVVQITYDTAVISYEELLKIFFTIHDPTTLNRQGADVGPQYRSVIFYHDKTQRESAERILDEVAAEKIWADPIVTQIEPFTEFFIAEQYHQDYFKRNPEQGYCQVVIAPKVVKFRKSFAEQLKV
ncbi:MAG TPA: peptide-methionine (S)-S-oxide reductase MsrA [Anaerolineales bacterium]|nr:peptide-methionine (S)-S-oxide reductase MsrA [Anaerolineales bacterium]